MRTIDRNPVTAYYKKDPHEILIPMDKIGHSEEISLSQFIDPSLKRQLKPGEKDIGLLGKVCINITTNGISKILTISDKQSEEEEDLKQALK